jgi:hypothetical protein
MTTEVTVYDPGKSLELQKVGVGLFKSGLFPNAKNEFGAFAIVQYGAELGIGPMMSLKNINIISGQLACNAQLMLSLALQRGVTYEVLEESDAGAKIKFKRGGAEYTSSFTKKDAEAAGLLGKDNWKKYGRDMYFWRTVAKGIRRVAPDAVMGLYTADEISEGKYIDVAEIPPESKDASHTSDGTTNEATVTGEGGEEKAIIENLKKTISGKMKGFDAANKKAFYEYVIGTEATVDKLQKFIDRYDEYREAFLKLKAA